LTTQAEQPTEGPSTALDLVGQLTVEVRALDAELAEIDMLIQQAHAEAERHETKRVAAGDKLAASKASGQADLAELSELYDQVLALTRRAIVMESQVEVLAGKEKALRRHRDRLAALAEVLGGSPDSGRALVAAGVPGTGAQSEGASAGPLPPEVSRMVLSAQEDLRRDIARAMHDGPAQSLTNIVLQAQIVERLIDREPASAMPEVQQLIAMVQSTLDATKSFIFDVRPMVLDDLGLMPTLRRAARDRGRRVQIPVDFDSLGPDRRLPMELESALFRMLEEALIAYLGAGPDRVSVRLDWSEQLEAVVRSIRDLPEGEMASADNGAGGGSKAKGRFGRGSGKAKDKGPEMPAALAAMIEDRNSKDAAAAAASVAPIPLPAKAWREIQTRAATLGATATLSADGSEMQIVVDLPHA